MKFLLLSILILAALINICECGGIITGSDPKDKRKTSESRRLKELASKKNGERIN